MAGESNPYAAGDKVYNGGSSAATQGAVDPMGYIDRSLENTPSPGSYTPGVAAGALSTLRNDTQQTTQQSPVVAPTQTPSPTQASTTGAISWKMPVDYDLQLQGIQQNSQYQDLLTQIAAQRNAAAQNRVVGLRDAQTGEVDQQRRDINNASYRGMARSSGYVTQIDKTQQYFNNLKTDIESRFMAALNNAQGQEIQGKSALDSTMEAIYREAARRLAEKITTDPNAGAIDKLPDTPKPPTPTPTPSGSSGNTGSGGNTPTGQRPAPRPLTPPKTTTTAPKPSSPTKYTVKSGDSLAAIAKKYNVSLAALKKANPNLASRDWRIYSGSKLVIPGK